MAVLFDVTVQHSGWQGPTFETGGWNDDWVPLFTGARAGSFWVSSLNGNRVDVGLGLHVDGVPTVAGDFFFNQNITGTATGAIAPSFPVVAANIRLRTFTRSISQTGQVLVRAVVSDAPTTPPPTNSPCAFGTRAKSTSPLAVYITNELLEAILLAVNLSWLRGLMVGVVGTQLAVEALCSAPPLPLPETTGSVTTWSLGTQLQALRSVAWPYFCECAPGSPTPVPYPPPTATQPPGVPVYPTFPCDPANLCASIEAIRQGIFALADQQQRTAAQVNLLQRYGLPFEFVPGAVHSNLTGEGQFQVPRLVGLKVDVTARPPAGLVLEGNPDYLWDMGWMAINDAAGMIEEKRITRSAMTWMPDRMQEAKVFTWALKQGVTIAVRELQAEV